MKKKGGGEREKLGSFLLWNMIVLSTWACMYVLVLGPQTASYGTYLPKVHTRPGLAYCGVEVTESSTNKQHHLSLHACMCQKRPIMCQKRPSMVSNTLISLCMHVCMYACTHTHTQTGGRHVPVQLARRIVFMCVCDDDPFIVLTETKFKCVCVFAHVFLARMCSLQECAPASPILECVLSTHTTRGSLFY